jgi:Holliday junction resolvasome RuvABC ATP-dependent DNA helicase subunit
MSISIVTNNQISELELIVGQSRLKEYLQQLSSGAQREKRFFPHSLVLGPSGYGKTTLVKALARDVSGKDAKYILCSPELTRNELCFELSRRREGTFLYLDEAHSLTRSCQELLFMYLDTGEIPTPGELTLDISTVIRAPRGPLLLSTNHPGSLRRELRNRLLQIALDEYRLEELEEIGFRQIAADRTVAKEAMRLLAVSASGSPRVMKGMMEEVILTTVRDAVVTIEHVQKLLELKRSSKDGLPPGPLRYIEFLGSQPESRARLYQLSSTLGLDPEFIRNEIEPVLHQKGYLVITGLGRQLSRLGKQFFNERIAQKSTCPTLNHDLN